MEETKVMSKQEAIAEVRKKFRGNKRFISYCEVMIASTNNFIGIDSTRIEKDNWNWEKFLMLSINFEKGFKMLHYRKGNKKYAPENTRIDKGNVTSDIHEFGVINHYNGESEEHRWEA